MTPRDDTSPPAADPRRAAAAEEEARALREDLLGWLEEGGAGDWLEERLDTLFRQNLEQAVAGARGSARVRETIERQVAARLADELRPEVERWAREEGRQALRVALSEALHDDRFRKELQEDLRQAALAAAPGGPAPPALRRPPTRSVAHHAAPDREKTLWWVAGGVAALLLLVAGIWFFFGRGDGGERTAAGTAGAVPAAVVEPAGAQGGPETATPAPAETPWLTRVRPAAGDSAALTARLEREGEEAFACWFPPERQPTVLAAVRDARPAEAFGECVGRWPVTDEPNLAVFAAQVAARGALGEIRRRGDCQAPPGNQAELGSFRADGRRGPSTYALLNELLSCRGLGSRLRVGADSTVHDYLAALALALEELGRAP